MDDRERVGEWSLDREAVLDWLVAHRRAAVAIGLTAALIAAVAYVALRPAQARAPVEQTLPRAQVSAISAPEPVVVAHISGEVVRPAVFQLEAGSRVADLVDAAGGFTADADPDRVNLAALVRDGDQVHIPAVGEVESVELGGVELVDVNRAGRAGLETLDGIGPALAAAIIEYRTRHGPFSSLEDLLSVSGIGPATLDRFRDDARV